MTTTLETVTSSDGTTIAFERYGEGPPVILIGGACNDRSTVAGLAASLASDVTAIAYDRRGRGGSGDNGSDYSVTREVDDIAALIERVGGSASLFGHSSGAILAIEATLRGLPVNALAAYEPPYVVDGTRPHPGADLGDRLRVLIEQERRD
ncbi:alpha/beta fold hydrolase [Actinopolymorpha pittospori]